MPNIRKNPPFKAAEEIETLAATGFSKVGIAAHFSISAGLLDRWLEQYERLQRAFDQGREKERHALHNSLYKAATDGKQIAAAMFLLKARHGYREGDQSESANKVTINFALPGAMTPEQFKLAKIVNRSQKVLNADSESIAE
jgi:transposase-like protein